MIYRLAHRQTWVARPLSVLTPQMLRDIIHRALVGRVRENLAASGVEADARLHRVVPYDHQHVRGTVRRLGLQEWRPVRFRVTDVDTDPTAEHPANDRPR
jgi:hypothetical protein